MHANASIPSRNTFPLGRIAVVTGCSGAIGRATARALADRRWNVVGTTRAKNIGTTVSETNLRVQPLDAEAVVRGDEWALPLLPVRSAVWGAVPSVALLVNNAAVCPAEWDAAAVQTALDVNVRLAARLADAYMFHSARDAMQPGAVVNISSGDGELCFFVEPWRSRIAAMDTMEQLERLMHEVVQRVRDGTLPADAVVHGPEPAYRLSKALLNRLTVVQARRAPRQVRVDAICPGDVRSAMTGYVGSRTAEEAAADIVHLVELQLASRRGDTTPSGQLWRYRQPATF